MLAKSKDSRRAQRRAKRQAQTGGAVPDVAETVAQDISDNGVALPGENLARDFVQDAAFANALPTMEDFQRRDAQSAMPVAPPAPEPWGVDAPAETSPLDAAGQNMFRLLNFDDIDERPADEDPYDATARYIGRGLPNKAGVYLLPYLQTGHLLLLLVLLLSSLISYPGFPLTEVPDEYRALLLQGLSTTYAINAAAAVYSIGIAVRKEQPVLFWVLKVFLLGGLALGELSEAVPDAPPPRPAPKRSGRR